MIKSLLTNRLLSHTKVPWFFVSLTLFVLISLPGFARFNLGYLNFTSFLSDFFVACVFLYPITGLTRWRRLPFLLLWTFIHIGSFELFRTMSRMPSWEDLLFLFDSHFLTHSVSGISQTEILWALFFTMGSLILFVPQKITKNTALSHLKVFLLSGITAILALSWHTTFLSSKVGITIYSEYNPIHWLLSHSSSEIENKTDSEGELLKQDLKGTRYISRGKAKNVLIITLEGLTGSYLKQSRAYFNLPQPQTEMVALSSFAEEGMILPDFVVHSHQTIRGLYSLLCADVSKLSWTTPKATLLQSDPDKAALCLPNQLKKHGFTTHYLQGAGLSFMGKDRFMPFIGFEEVHGLEWFPDAENKNYNWGVDDRTFFKGVLEYIDGINQKKQPWLLTVLTVGTHQPYEVSDSFAADYLDKKQASVAYLDSAINDFLTEFKQRGLLKNTLVIITADESHGSELGDWASSWTPYIIYAPEQKKLPKLNTLNYGLFDTTFSVLDYFSFKIPKEIPGRSFFRKYSSPREMVSFTADRLRWLDDTGHRLECTTQGKCQKCLQTSLIGSADCKEISRHDSLYWINKAHALDNNLTRVAQLQTLRFANGKKYTITRPWNNQWADSLIGAQYLDFPAQSEMKVHFKWKAIKTTSEGAKLRLVLKEADRDVHEAMPVLPILQTGETTEVSFVIKNEKARNGFSFHLLPEAPMTLEIIDFTITVHKNSDNK